MRVWHWAAIGLLASAGWPTAVLAQTSGQEDGMRMRTLLTEVCATRPGEPACASPVDLREDEAWLVLRTACRPITLDETACGTYWREQGPTLIFDRRAREWRAEWETRLHPLTFDVAGTPTLRLRPRDARPLKILITEISPIAYTATPGTPTETTLAVIDGLKALLALAGTGIQSVIQVAATTAPVGVADIVAMMALEGKAAETEMEKAACETPPPQVDALAASLADRHQRLTTIAGAMSALETSLGTLQEARTAFVRVAQRAEDGAPVRLDDLPPPAVETIVDRFDRLSSEAGALRQASDTLASCQPLLAAYVTMLGAPADITVLKALRSQVAGATGCRIGAITGSIAANADALLSCPAGVADGLKLHAGVMKPLAERLLNARQVEEKVWQAFTQALAARATVEADARTLASQVARARRHTWNGALVREIVVTRPNPRLGWNKVQSHSIDIEADSPYVKELRLSGRPKETISYKLESSAGRILGYGIGVVYTPLHESTWTAVTVPGTTTKVIAETGRETRAGDLAAFLTYRFLEHWPARRVVQPVLDAGVGVTSGRPAFFLGAGLELARAARVSAGWTPQRVTRLAPGQVVNVTTVSGTDDIRTERHFDTGHWYLSVSFALDSLSLFNKP